MLGIEILSSWLALAAQGYICLFVTRKVNGLPNSSSWLSVLTGVSVSLFGTLLFSSWVAFAGAPLVVSKLAIAVFALIIWSTQLRGSRQSRSSLRSQPVALSTKIFFLGLLLPHLILDLVKPDFSVDGMLYHGPVLANLLGKQGLWGWSEPNEYIYYSDLSIFQSAIQANLTQPILLEDAFQVPFFAMISIALLALLERSKLSSHLKYLSIFSLLTAPVIWLQPRILYVDLAYAASILATVALLLGLARARTTNLWTLTAVIVSIASVLGTKPAGLLAAGFLVFVSMFLVIRNKKSEDEHWATYLTVAAVAIGPLVLGSAFYLRNLIAFRNPIYPVSFEFASLSFPGKIDPSVFGGGGSLISEVPGRIFSFVSNLGGGLLAGPTKLDYDPRSGGFGLSTWLIVSLLVVATIYIFRAKETFENSAIKESVFLVLIGTAVLVLQPMTSDARYVIGPYLLFAAASVLLLPPLTKATNTAFFWGFIALTALNVVSVEGRFLMGAGSILYLNTIDQAYQPSTPGNHRGVATGMKWLDQDGKKNIYVQSETGVGISGLTERTQLMQQSYQLYGLCLCNSVSYSHGGLLQNGALKASAERQITTADYVLLYPDTFQELGTKLQGLYLVARILPIEGVYEEGYYVLGRHD